MTLQQSVNPVRAAGLVSVAESCVCSCHPVSTFEPVFALFLCESLSHRKAGILQTTSTRCVLWDVEYSHVPCVRGVRRGFQISRGTTVSGEFKSEGATLLVAPGNSLRVGFDLDDFVLVRAADGAAVQVAVVVSSKW